MSTPTLTAAAQEVLDGFLELVAEYGAPITFTAGAGGTYNGLLVFPTAGNDMDSAGFQATAMDGVQLACTDFLAAGVTETSRFTVGTNPQVLHVTAIEDDPGSPIVYFSAEEVE